MFDNKREAPEDQTTEEIWETKQKIARLETNSVIGNPGYPGINQNILFCLDHKSQMAFRQVCQSWKEQVDQPIFWIKKLNLKSQGLGNVWIDLVGKIKKEYDLVKEVTECLMKFFGLMSFPVELLDPKLWLIHLCLPGLAYLPE